MATTQYNVDVLPLPRLNPDIVDLLRTRFPGVGAATELAVITAFPSIHTSQEA